MHRTTAAVLAALLSTASALPSNLQARDEGKSTKVTLGRNYVDYGCDGDIQKLLREAIEDKCVGEAQCDDASPYVAKISWTWDESENTGVTGQSNWPEEREIRVTVEGEYPNKDTLKGVKDLIIESVQEETWEKKDIDIWKPQGWSPTGIGNAGDSGTCGMMRFPNFIGVAMFDGDQAGYTISITVAVDDSIPDDSFCGDETQDGLDIVLTGAGSAGGYLSAVSGLFCAAFDD